MTSLSIKPVDPVSRPFFGGEVSGVDLTRPLSREQASAIEAGMDQHPVLVHARLDRRRLLPAERPRQIDTGHFAAEKWAGDRIDRFDGQACHATNSVMPKARPKRFAGSSGSPYLRCI